MRVLGVDVGATGALALVDATTGAANRLVELADMPTTKVRVGQRHVSLTNAPLLAEVVRRMRPDLAVLEQLAARPGQGVSSMFAFGRALGVVEGVLGCLEVPVVYLTPPVWKKAVGIPAGADKDMSRAMALRLFPSAAGELARVKDHGRADAVCIAIAGARLT